jgi:hypothetical protein
MKFYFGGCLSLDYLFLAFMKFYFGGYLSLVYLFHALMRIFDARM